jgi:sugar phosphate isomerase/epimerase
MQQRHVFWAANVRTKPFAERLIAAAAGGFEEMSIFPIDVKTFADGGLPPSALRRAAAEHGVRISVLDPYALWVPDATPAAWATASDLAFVGFREDEIFRMAEALGVESINLIETFGNAVHPDAGAERFAGFADRAAQYGWRAQLEFMPFSGVPDLAAAWDIVRRAGRDGGGLTFDTWHYYRGRPDDALLRTIPGDRVFQVQFADAARALNGTLVNDLLHHRMFPGEGEFPLGDVAATLAGIGGLTAVGVELFSDAIDAMPASEAGARVGASLRALLAPAAPPPGGGPGAARSAVARNG